MEVVGGMDVVGQLPATVQELFGLQGKVALVLGGGYGMGEACAKWLAHAGCDVVIGEIIPERAERVAADIRSMGRRSHAAIGDMTDHATVDRLLPEAEAELGGIDILVSIIGQAGWFTFLDMSAEDWALDQRRNLEYFVHCSQWVARSIARRGTGGAICAIASVDGIGPSPMHASYGAAKAGIISMVRTMASELAEFGIRVNCIAPGTTKTPRAISRSSYEAVDERAKTMGIPLGRAGHTSEIARAVLFLVSDMSPYVTGITLPLDGGWLVMRPDIGSGNRR